MLRQDDFLKSQLVLYGWRAGKEYGGHLAACMIMSCLANRQRLGWSGNNWMGVLESIPHFSATLEQPTGTPSVWSPEFVKLLHEVDAIFDGTQDYSKGALYWADTNKIDNPWFRDKILGNRDDHPIVGNMNTLTLFR